MFFFIIVYISEDKLESPYPLIPKPTLKWLNKKEVGDVSYCVPFEASAAACTEYVGGKGASLALLASVQKEQVLILKYYV